jgi:hypothetical protein
VLHGGWEACVCGGGTREWHKKNVIVVVLYRAVISPVCKYAGIAGSASPSPMSNSSSKSMSASSASKSASSTSSSPLQDDGQDR